ncbi:hypothetical protein EPUS_04803 [Endocarpon pusillum Z07020]|uniref:VWFA domain-containing protein n=1 Tax=Endocarpon pusillum (strain Z07020 / HMAS-L-300199) TaxID=1263415 RepID=U1HQP0_ENDPU|nr:uncharacterized protein EPUS_04803 [Endocarpon pusillum Z07020]ERF72750.1 hypothetical protein EPUS_04803 [Endocarpon pusillum Z07020]
MPWFRTRLPAPNDSPSRSERQVDEVVRRTELSGVSGPGNAQNENRPQLVQSTTPLSGSRERRPSIIPRRMKPSSQSLGGASRNPANTAANNQSELSKSKELQSKSTRAPQNTKPPKSVEATRISEVSGPQQASSGAPGSREASKFTKPPKSEESSGPKNAPRSGKAATSRQGFGSEMPSEFNGVNGANMPLRLEDAPGPGKPSNVDVTNPGTKNDSKTGLCWKKAILLLRKEHPKEFEVLLSASEEKSLKEEEVFDCLGLTSKEQVKSGKAHIYVERLWQALEPFQQLGMIASRVDPHGIAPFAVASLFLLVKLARGLEYRELVIEIFSDITCMMMRWYHFETRLFNQHDPSLINTKDQIDALKGRLTDLFFAALKLAATIYKYLDGHMALRLGRRLIADKVKWQNMLKELRAIEAQCKACKEVMDAESKFQKDNASILAWITNTNQKRDHELLRASLGIDKVYKDCGKWLFITPEYHNWKKGRPASKPVLWLKGTVGTGKTTLMCRAIEELREDFKYGDHGEHPVIHYYCTGTPCVQEEYDKHKLDNPVDCRFSTTECEELLKKLIPSDPKKLRITIVIDALDECEDNGYELLEILGNLLQSRPQSIRLLLSSQLHVRVEENFGDNITESLRVNSTVTKDDMHTFIETEMEKRAKTPGNRILDSRTGLYVEVAGELTNRAMGMFQWVKLRIGIFFPKPPLETTTKVQKELKELRTANPKDLNPTYRRLYANNVIQYERQNTAKTYRLILSAYKPLTLKQVREAVSIENDGKINNEVDEEYIRRRCHSFVIENEDGYLQFAHESARLFLEKVENHGDKDFADVDDFSDTANHREMLEICLKLMMRPNHPMWIPDELRFVQQNGGFDCSSRVTKTNYEQNCDMLIQCMQGTGFSAYTLKYLGYHCRKLGSTQLLGPGLSRDLSNVITEPNTALLWWYRFVITYLSPQEFKDSGNHLESYNQCRRFQKKVLVCMQNNRTPNPFLAVCIWDLAECVDELQARLFPKNEEWSSALQLPLDVCCFYGSSRTLSKLVDVYPAKADALIMEAHGFLGKIPIQVAVEQFRVDVTRILLEFERKRAHITKQERWTSNQLLCLRPLSKRMRILERPDAVPMLKLLLEFEADQTGARFPPSSEECWRGWDIQILSCSTAELTELEAALGRNDSNGGAVVELLLRKYPDHWNVFARDNYFKRPQLVQTPSGEGEKAIKIACRNRDYDLFDPCSPYQELIDVLLKFGAQLADAEEKPAVEKSARACSVAPPQTKEEYVEYAEDFVAKNINNFVDVTEESVKSIAEVAAAQADIVATELGLRPEVTPGLVKLAFYDFVILCDDSSSMTFDEQCIPALNDTLRQVAHFATILQPKGISVRFLNHDEGNARRYDNLTDAHDIAVKVSSVPFYGNTRLGSVLNDKIVRPRIIDKITSGKLERPVFVVIITDGQPTDEHPESLRNTIRYCKDALSRQSYRDAAAVFLISQVGDAAHATTFLKSLETDPQISSMVLCSTENMAAKLAQFQSSQQDKQYTAWVSKSIPKKVPSLED